MNCEKYFYLIDDLIENELDAQTAAQINSHLFVCPECRAEYESLKQEKEIYAHYLFDVEPPQNLRENFQTRLAAEQEKTARAAVSTRRETVKKPGFFSFLRLSPALIAAVVLIVFGIGFGWIKFAPDEIKGDQDIAETKTDSLEMSSKSTAEEKSISIFPPEIKNDAPHQRAKNNKIADKNDSAQAKKAVFSIVRRPYRAQVSQNERNSDSAQAKRNLPDTNREGEAEQQKRQVKNLENEIAAQIEKIELLLRSFRNARETENIETFDIEYEKSRARALLEKNARLRRDAENYGVFYAEELLSRAEPYLLDIANLENNAKRDEVLDIKERVKNQNIIASLQIY